ncbi:hypothetical protein [Bradymonas sediminis]|uniref:Uncharacterized protein n=1 Tax=Bradymonas sediminis TaxID=1548548 RepID=A0A2Z4FH33_9DELT|nr:hypothetical protein [Bradymonas sediminis]AWV87936.1 hypothetical protein DN745_00760 [Bradymonas sediminis]TDP62954.1 hypothetical protein DFR33_11187 [Bradymonas sediminis]
MKKLSILLVALAIFAGCSDDSGSPSDNTGDASSVDASNQDASTLDTAADEDTASPDAGSDAEISTDAESDATPDADTSEPVDPTGCAPLPASAGTEVRVSPAQVGELPQIVRDAASGTTILLEDGTYMLGAPLQFRTPGVTLRSASDDASAVIIDANYSVNEVAFITASDVTLAHITITRAVDHPVHVTPGSAGVDVTGTVLYGLRLIDAGEQFVKVNSNSARDAWVDYGRVECSYFEMTDAGRPNVERNPGGCYTGGIDVHSARGWVVRHNEFHGIYCAGEGLAEHAIHFWKGPRDTLVENNLIVNCARGIGFGLVENGQGRAYADDPYPGVGHIGHYDGVIRNNVIYADIPWYDTGIELAQARGAKVYHNTVFSTDAATGFFSSIDYRFANTDVDIRNNLTRRITVRGGASGRVENNKEGIDASYFVDASNLDFHLADGANEAIDKGVSVSEAGLDIDGETHDKGAAPDLGADEAK